MLWTLLAMGGGIASTLFVLWRKAIVEKERDVLKKDLATRTDERDRSLDEMKRQGEVYTDQIARREGEIAVLKEQRNNALDALQHSSCPGSLRDSLRLSLGVPTKAAPADSKPSPDRGT